MNQKGVILSTIVAALITAGATLYIYYDKKDNGFDVLQTKNEDNKSSNNKVTKHEKPSLEFSEVFVTPVDTEIFSSFYTEILNTGNEEAKDFFLSIDFGESTPEKCEIKTVTNAVQVNKTNTSLQYWKIPELAENQSIYLICSINSPFFKKISVGGGNLDNNKQLTYSSYKEQKEVKAVTFYESLLRFILGTIAGILLLYFFFKVIGSLLKDEE